MADRGLYIFTGAVVAALLAVLAIVVATHIEVYYLVEQTDAISGATALELPSIGPAGQGEAAKVGIFAALPVTPYDPVNGTTTWRFSASGSPAAEVHYVCRLDYSIGFTVYVFGQPLLQGTAPASERDWTLIDAQAPAGSGGGTVHLPGSLQLPIYGGLYGGDLPTYRS